MVNAYQGFLPTYLYAFQFPVDTTPRPAVPLLSPVLLALTLAVAARRPATGETTQTSQKAHLFIHPSPAIIQGHPSPMRVVVGGGPTVWSKADGPRGV